MVDKSVPTTKSIIRALSAFCRPKRDGKNDPLIGVLLDRNCAVASDGAIMARVFADVGAQRQVIDPHTGEAISKKYPKHQDVYDLYTEEPMKSVLLDVEEMLHNLKNVSPTIKRGDSPKAVIQFISGSTYNAAYIVKLLKLCKKLGIITITVHESTNPKNINETPLYVTGKHATKKLSADFLVMPVAVMTARMRAYSQHACST